MKITIITSSMRKNSETKRVGEFCFRMLKKKDIKAELVDLQEFNFPFFDDTIEEDKTVALLWKPLSKKLQNSEGFIFVTPEWNGMASPMLKNFLMYVEDECVNKPVLLVSVTSGFTNGAYPIAELRSSSYKNARFIYTPHHVIVRSVKSCFHDKIAAVENKPDIIAREKIDFATSELIEYADALATMRKKSHLDQSIFEYGM